MRFSFLLFHSYIIYFLLFCFHCDTIRSCFASACNEACLDESHVPNLSRRLAWRHRLAATTACDFDVLQTNKRPTVRRECDPFSNFLPLCSPQFYVLSLLSGLGAVFGFGNLRRKLHPRKYHSCFPSICNFG